MDYGTYATLMLFRLLQHNSEFAIYCAVQNLQYIFCMDFEVQALSTGTKIVNSILQNLRHRLCVLCKVQISNEFNVQKHIFNVYIYIVA